MEFDNDRQVFYLYVNNTTGNLFERKTPKCLNATLKHKWVCLRTMSLQQAESVFNWPPMDGDPSF